jgi:hypothetical protein
LQFSFFKIVGVLIASMAISACATKPVAEPVASIDKYLKDADTALAAGQKDQALVLLDKASSAYPTRKEPWARSAQINFDAGNYGLAILKAQEAVQRDPVDLQSNSILAVGGLRVSTKALTDLRQGQALKGGVRTDAESLAKILRETLGETVLVPTAGSSATSSNSVVIDSQPASVSRSGVRPAPKNNTAAKPAKPATKPADSTDNSNADPFSTLRK